MVWPPSPVQPSLRIARSAADVGDRGGKHIQVSPAPAGTEALLSPGTAPASQRHLPCPRTGAPPIPVRRIARPEARKILDLILDTSAMRYRELYGFSHPDESAVFHADAGRGVEIFFFGVPPAWRLPLRAYHAGMFFKNGVPAGYVELLSLFERAEVGFNLYYTFREGESAWLFARLFACSARCWA